MNKSHLILALLIFYKIGGAFLCSPVQAQNLQTSEIGFGIGGLNYKGEIAPEYNILNNRPAAMLFYRRDISKPVTLRASAMYGLLRMNDRRVKQPLHQERNVTMDASLLEVAAGLEYNFLDFYDLHRKVRWTPYFFLNGAGYLLSRSVTAPGTAFDDDDVEISIAIPIGFGVKYALNKHWNLGFEAGARKIFSDTFDNLTGEGRQAGQANPYNNDWYFYNGFSLSYTFYKILCPDHLNTKPSPLN